MIVTLFGSITRVFRRQEKVMRGRMSLVSRARPRANASMARQQAGCWRSLLGNNIRALHRAAAATRAGQAAAGDGALVFLPIAQGGAGRATASRGLDDGRLSGGRVGSLATQKTGELLHRWRMRRPE